MSFMTWRLHIAFNEEADHKYLEAALQEIRDSLHMATQAVQRNPVSLGVVLHGRIPPKPKEADRCQG